MAGSSKTDELEGPRYDKGERRFKHVGKGPKPYIEFDSRRPRRWVGKCPDNLTADDLKDLLKSAIPAPNGDRELAAPKKLYTVAHGAIYEAQTSDFGGSYHGYPYRGKLSRTLIGLLRAKAEQDGALDSFEKWLKENIETHGA
ncbi:Uncharacterised protein [Brevundimonas vesicularis]|uniref:Uncharacterized protein n=1 Tax=Brevundimonas vesicularis TaxID=41276 RepID=A0A2X1BDX7_BREVE|nr:hypothetical protein [Brevundimonas vesicularis]SPU55613.1 Uncharacterised protein [Brevundimonas vesicularis]